MSGLLHNTQTLIQCWELPPSFVADSLHNPSSFEQVRVRFVKWSVGCKMSCIRRSQHRAVSRMSQQQAPPVAIDYKQFHWKMRSSVGSLPRYQLHQHDRHFPVFSRFSSLSPTRSRKLCFSATCTTVSHSCFYYFCSCFCRSHTWNSSSLSPSVSQPHVSTRLLLVAISDA